MGDTLSDAAQRSHDPSEKPRPVLTSISVPGCSKVLLLGVLVILGIYMNFNGRYGGLLFHVGMHQPNITMEARYGSFARRSISRESKQILEDWISTFERDVDTLMNHSNVRWPDESGHLLHVVIKDNVLWVENDCFPKPQATLFMLQRVLCLYKIPDMEMFINTKDGPMVKVSDKVAYPIFSWVKSASYLDLMIPYWSFVWVPWCENSEHSKRTFSRAHYASKINKAFWRGSATGGYFTEENWRNQTRAKLSLLCEKNQEICDAGIVQCSQCSEEAAIEMEDVLGYKNRTEPDYFQKYKIAILVDGNTSPSSRSLQYMSSDSLILWQKTPNWEFFYRTFLPYVHYVPVSNTLCDLIENIRIYLEEDLQAEDIVRNMMEVSRHLCADTVAAYMAASLSVYASKVQQRNLESVKTSKVSFLSRLADFPHEYQYFKAYMDGKCIQTKL